MRLGAVVLVTTCLLGACSRPTASDPSVPAVSDTTTIPVVSTAPPTTAPPPPPTAPPTVAPTTSAVPTTPPPTTPPTSAPAETTTTTEPIAQTLLELRGDGLGTNVFGAAPDGVIDYVTSTLGGNTDDTGWVDSATLGLCPGTKARRVEWGTLKLWFADSSAFATDREHFFAWEYGQLSELGGEPVGLRTPGGLTLGSHVSDLQAEFPDAVITAAPDDLDAPATYFVADTFFGWLTGVDPDDSVVVMFGGVPCGSS